VVEEPFSQAPLDGLSQVTINQVPVKVFCTY
jgi:hypothetical protein